MINQLPTVLTTGEPWGVSMFPAFEYKMRAATINIYPNISSKINCFWLLYCWCQKRLGTLRMHKDVSMLFTAHRRRLTKYIQLS